MPSVMRPGSGSRIAMMIMSPPYKYFRFFVTVVIFRIPAFTSSITYIGNVNINPHNKRLNPTVEKKTVKSYLGGRFNNFENINNTRIDMGKMNK